MRTSWILYRRGVIIVGAIVAALTVFSAGVLVLVMTHGHHAASTSSGAAVAIAPSGRIPSPVPRATASYVASWDALPTVVPATTPELPDLAAAARDDPTSIARAFAIELFTRSYRKTTRSELIAWAQAVDSPLRSPNYPQRDWTKVLVDSLVDPTWDDAASTPIPSDGEWLALRSEQATETVSDVQIRSDTQWEDAIAGGYEPVDKLATTKDVTLTVDRTAVIGGHRQIKHFDVSLAVQLGSAPRGGFGVAATNNYVIRERD